ncbi:MAG: hypothetical protein ACRDVC_06580 [Acidimicrobiales bacterium]
MRSIPRAYALERGRSRYVVLAMPRVPSRQQTLTTLSPSEMGSADLIAE